MRWERNLFVGLIGLGMVVSALAADRFLRPRRSETPQGVEGRVLPPLPVARPGSERPEWLTTTGSVALVVLVAKGCASCDVNHDRLELLLRRARCERRISVGVGSAEEYVHYWGENAAQGFSEYTARAVTLARLWRVTQVPVLLVLGQDGRVRFARVAGADRQLSADLDDACTMNAGG